MFCPNCGNQVRDNEKFCGKCGTKLQEAAPQPEQPVYQQPYQQAPQQPQYQPYQQAPVQPMANPQAAGSIRILHLIVIITSLLSAILWFCKGMYASAMGIKQTGSFHQMCDGGGEILSVLNVIFAIIIIALMIWPVLSNTLNKYRLLIGTKIWAILQLLAFAIVMLATAGQASGYYGSMVSWGLTFPGWLYVICVAVNIVVPYLITSKSKVFKNK